MYTVRKRYTWDLLETTDSIIEAFDEATAWGNCYVCARNGLRIATFDENGNIVGDIYIG